MDKDIYKYKQKIIIIIVKLKRQQKHTSLPTPEMTEENV